VATSGCTTLYTILNAALAKISREFCLLLLITETMLGFLTVSRVSLMRFISLSSAFAQTSSLSSSRD
jgi:hypothetical protein